MCEGSVKKKVLIVDDEKLERILIRKSFDWEANGFEVIREAESGSQALEIIELFRPQLILTDINMPYMDGLIMTEEINKLDYFCKIIIITGYRDFEYARQAIRLGVTDFILKPVQVKDMTATILKVKSVLDEEDSNIRLTRELEAQKNENHKILFESFLQRLVENRTEASEEELKLKRYGMECLKQQCFCCTIKLHFQTGESESHLKNQEVLELIEKEQLPQIRAAFVHYQGMVVLLMSDILLSKIEALKQSINETLNLDAVMGCSNLVKKEDCIRTAFLQSKHAVNASVVKGHNALVTYEEYEEIKNSGNKEVNIDWNDFSFSLEQGIVNKAEDYIDQYTKLISVNERVNRDYIRLMAINLISKAVITLWKKGKDISALAGEDYVYDSISSIEDINEMNHVLKEMIHKIMVYHMDSYSKKENKTIKQILSFMEAHLFEKELSLKTVAKEHFINDSYLSRLFKQEVGKSMMEYIMEHRIKESIRLLNTTDLKAYEIAEQIGIGDPHYFSICFKKYTGVTINEYKKTK